MRRRSLRTHRSKRLRHSPPGTAPGSVIVPDDALNLRVKAIRYDEFMIDEQSVTSASQIKARLDANPGSIHWIDIKGLGDKTFYEQLADCFGIHRLQMEDVMNTYQRPKAEEYQGHLFLVSRVIREAGMGLSNEQISLFLGPNFVISIQDKYDDFLNPVLDRLRLGKGHLRKQGADYLAYSIMDLVVDTYYPLLEKIADKLDELEDELIEKPTRESLNKLLSIKRELILVRRVIWSERDKVNDILRSAFPLIRDSTKIFFRDTYDHCIQLIDLVESYKEITASLMDVYMSSVSNRLNQVMKVLTIISTIFIPLTFIVGLYGMNFQAKNPVTGEILPYNMPELYSPYGYIGVMVFMLLIVLLQLYFFVKKGWLTSKKY